MIEDVERRVERLEKDLKELRSVVDDLKRKISRPVDPGVKVRRPTIAISPPTKKKTK